MAALRSKQVMFTLYGDYVRHIGGSLWVASLIQLLARLGMSEQSVRSTIVRMSRAGWLRVDRINRKSYYSLTSNGKRLLDEGADRIFHSYSPRQPWDGKWRLVAYSIPETLRDKREQLRQELGYLGFGSLTNALWISPRDLRSQVEQLATALEIKEHVVFYTATHDGFSSTPSLVAQCWNLPVINSQYGAFIGKYQPLYVECRANSQELEPSECFVRRFSLIHEYRRFPFIDPQLPAELLPGNWCGGEAANLFHAYHDLLADKANAFFRSIALSPSKSELPNAQVSQPRVHREISRREM